MKLQHSILTLAIILSSTQIALADNISAAQKKLKDLPIPSLNEGYSDDMQIPVGLSCLADGPIKFDGGTKSIVNLGKEYSFDDIQKALNVNVSADGSIGMFSAGTDINYANYIKNTDYSESFNYLEQILLPTKEFQPAGFGVNALNDFGKMAYAAGPDQFRISCGNRFYQAETLGANLFVSLKMVFNSAYDKSNFDMSVSGNIGDFFSASSNIQKTVQEKHINGTLEVLAYQDGGDPTQLPKIFTKCGDSYCVTSCTLDNLVACQNTINGVITYAQNNFPPQIGYQDGQVTGTANPLSYTLNDYVRYGITNVGKSVLTPEILAARQYLGGLYQDTLRNMTIINHMLDSKITPSILKTYSDQLKVLSQNLGDNAALLDDSNNGAIACYLQPTSCVAIRQQIDSELKPLDANLLNMFETGYIARGQSSIYLIIPIGGNQYQAFDQSGTHMTAQQTMTLSADGNTLHLDGIDIGSQHFHGDFNKTGDQTYSGTEIYDNGRRDLMQFSVVENPA